MGLNCFCCRTYWCLVDAEGYKWLGLCESLFTKSALHFCGKDICEILGFKNFNDALLKQVKQTYKSGLKSIGVTCGYHVNPVSYHAGKAVYISGPGLCRLIFSSCLEAAEKFRCWVFKEVLPSLHKVGDLFHDPIKVMKIYSSSPSRMADIPIAYNSSRVRPINLKWLYLRSACSSSSSLLSAWILFGFSISTMTSCSGICQSNHLSFTYLLLRCILST